MSKTFRYGLFFLVPLVILLDQWSKWLVLKTPQLNALSCLEGTARCGKIEISSLFDISMVWNWGVSFGQMQSDGIMRWVLVAFQLGIALGFGVWLLRAERRWTGIALALVIGGAIGNVTDRVRFGAVADFIDFSGPWFDLYVGKFKVGFPWVFNVADAAISVGAVLLFIDQFLMSRSESSAGTETET